MTVCLLVDAAALVYSTVSSSTPLSTAMAPNKGPPFPRGLDPVLYLMSTILMTDALPMRCRATMLSPRVQYPLVLACSMAAASTYRWGEEEEGQVLNAAAS